MPPEACFHHSFVERETRKAIIAALEDRRAKRTDRIARGIEATLGKSQAHGMETSWPERGFTARRSFHGESTRERREFRSNSNSRRSRDRALGSMAKLAGSTGTLS